MNRHFWVVHMGCRPCSYLISKMMLDFGLGVRVSRRRVWISLSWIEALGCWVFPLGLGVRESRRCVWISISWIEVLDCWVFDLGLGVVSWRRVWISFSWIEVLGCRVFVCLSAAWLLLSKQPDYKSKINAI